MASHDLPDVEFPPKSWNTANGQFYCDFCGGIMVDVSGDIVAAGCRVVNSSTALHWNVVKEGAPTCVDACCKCQNGILQQLEEQECKPTDETLCLFCGTWKLEECIQVGNDFRTHNVCGNCVSHARKGGKEIRLTDYVATPGFSLVPVDAPDLGELSFPAEVVEGLFKEKIERYIVNIFDPEDGALGKWEILSPGIYHAPPPEDEEGGWEDPVEEYFALAVSGVAPHSVALVTIAQTKWSRAVSLVVAYESFDLYKEALAAWEVYRAETPVAKRLVAFSIENIAASSVDFREFVSTVLCGRGFRYGLDPLCF